MSKGKSDSDIEFYSLRERSILMRQIMISEIIKNSTNVGLVIVDGSRDLVDCINDEANAQAISSGYMKITSKYNLHLATVLHTNKNNKQARGHLGVELVNKAETTLLVSRKSETVSQITTEFSRKQSPPQFLIKINEHGIPVKESTMMPPIETANKFHYKDPINLSEKEHLQILKKVKNQKKDNRFGYGDFKKRLKEVIKSEYGTIGDNKIHGFLTYYKKKECIKHHGTTNSKNSYYSIEPH